MGSLADVIDLANAGGKGLFVLAATSNAESVDTQTAVLGRGEHRGRTVAAGIVEEVRSLNSSAPGLGSIGVVIGATVRSADYGIDASSLSNTPVLAPGFGEQGALITDLPALFGVMSGTVVANIGRSVLRAGPDGARTVLSSQAAILASGVSR